MTVIGGYLSRGWGLVPLHYVDPAGTCSCGAGAFPAHRSAGKHPTEEQWNARVRRDDGHWRASAQPWNVGIATGAASQLWGLDWDPRCPGVTTDSMALLARVLGEIGPPAVHTGGGGSHWYLELPDFRIGGSSGRLPPGWDVRGEGGQLVAPPSVSGKGAYVAGAIGVRPAKDWLLDLVRPPAPRVRSDVPPVPVDGGRGSGYARAAMEELLGELTSTWHGRNQLAFRCACRIIELINAGWLDEGNAYERWAAATVAHPDLTVVVPDAEVAAIWRSATRRIGHGAAELPAMDVLPPLPPLAPPPFPVASMNGSSAGLPPPSIPGVTLADPGAAPTVEVELTPWEIAVRRAMSAILAREEAKRRVADMQSGDRASVKARLRAEIIDTPALLARPRLEPVVEGLLFRNTLARIVGKPGHGKSFVVLDLGAHVAAGLPWAGRRTYATRGAYVVAEGDEGFGGRVEAWQAHHERGVDLVYLPRAVQIGGPEWPAWCEVMAEDGYGFIVIDTQARATVGRDEIDGRDMGEVGAALDDLRRMTRALVILVHHTNMSGGTTGRGHGGMLAGLETELFVSMAGRVITVKGGKSKDTAAPEDMIFDLVDVARVPTAVAGVVLADPRPVPIGVVPVWRNEVLTAAPEARESARSARARQLWQVIHDRYNPGMGGTQSEIKAAWADVAWAGKPTIGAPGAPFRKAWSRAWADLIQLGLLVKAFGAARFKVVTLADQSAGGVLTSNRKGAELVSEGPEGFEVVMTDVTDGDGEL